MDISYAKKFTVVYLAFTGTMVTAFYEAFTIMIRRATAAIIW